MKPDSSQTQQKVREKTEPKKKSLKQEKKTPATKKGAKKAKEARPAFAGGPGGSDRPPSPLLPLRQFVDNPSLMIEQLFQAIGREELAAMQPTILQGLPQEEVKQLCLKQLESLSKQEVLDILSGCEVKDQKYAVLPNTTTSVVTSSTGTTVASDVTKIVETTKIGEGVAPVVEVSEALELFPASEDMEMLAMDEPQTVTSAATGAPPGPNPPGQADLATNLTKMQMEILELQLRRRAIKALLRSQKGPGEEDDDDDDDDEEEEIVLKEEKG